MWRRRGWRRKARLAAAWPNPARAVHHGAGLRHSGHAGPKRIGRAVRGYLLHDVRAETALLILAPSLPFMAVSGAVRGCFLAARRVQPNIQRSSSNSWCGWPSPRRGCGRWPSGARGYELRRRAAGQHGQRERLLRHYAGFCRTHAGICTPARCAAAPPHPQGAVRHPVARRGQPPAGQRPAGGGKQPDPYTLAIYTGSRAEAVAQYGS